MKYTEAQQGRTFIVQLEEGEIFHEAIETLASQENVQAGVLIAVGGISQGSSLIVGPQNESQRPIEPMKVLLENVHEIAGTGTLFPDEKGQPILHMHFACGRENNTKTGCVRDGVIVWKVMEVVLLELINTDPRRVFDQDTGFQILQVSSSPRK